MSDGWPNGPLNVGHNGGRAKIDPADRMVQLGVLTNFRITREAASLQFQGGLVKDAPLGDRETAKANLHKRTDDPKRRQWPRAQFVTSPTWASQRVTRKGPFCRRLATTAIRRNCQGAALPMELFAIEKLNQRRLRGIVNCRQKFRGPKRRLVDPTAVMLYAQALGRLLRAPNRPDDGEECKRDEKSAAHYCDYVWLSSNGEKLPLHTMSTPSGCGRAIIEQSATIIHDGEEERSLKTLPTISAFKGRIYASERMSRMERFDRTGYSARILLGGLETPGASC
uniref:Uncharacterized protein n=1 Tax=Trichuris muris TaxID=70415 RepID=A0A5S6R0X8_TRIMR